MDARRCIYCGDELRPNKFESGDMFQRRNYCMQPLCLARGGEERVKQLYAKTRSGAKGGVEIAKMVRWFFVLSFGVPPLWAFDRWSDASTVWMQINNKVVRGEAMRILVNVAVLSSEGEEVALEELDERVLLSEPLSEDQAKNFVATLSGMITENIIDLVDAYEYGDTPDDE